MLKIKNIKEHLISVVVVLSLTFLVNYYIAYAEKRKKVEYLKKLNKEQNEELKIYLDGYKDALNNSTNKVLIKQRKSSLKNAYEVIVADSEVKVNEELKKEVLSYFDTPLVADKEIKKIYDLLHNLKDKK